MATDNGDPAQTTSVTVQININDINEYDPEFSQSLYNVTGPAFNDTLPGVCMSVCVCVYTCVCAHVCLYTMLCACCVCVCMSMSECVCVCL